VQYAKVPGATVVAVDLEDDKLQMAKELVADYVVNAAEQDPAAEIQKLGGADAAIASPCLRGRSSRPSTRWPAAGR
jgi:alcohol dehydrogenase, propanol-preferring